jgi:uncharacterized membrane protein YccF (DUF307 family)
MSFLGNVLWFICGGFLAFVGYVVAGLALCVTVVGIPFGLMSIRLGVAMLAPFGKQVVERRDANTPLRLIFNVVWVLLFGWGIALAHVASALACAVTIIGIPFCRAAPEDGASRVAAVRSRSGVGRSADFASGCRVFDQQSWSDAGCKG